MGCIIPGPRGRTDYTLKQAHPRACLFTGRTDSEEEGKEVLICPERSPSQHIEPGGEGGKCIWRDTVETSRPGVNAESAF